VVGVLRDVADALAVIRNVVVVEVLVTLVRNAVGVAVLTCQGGDVARVRYTVAVAVFARWISGTIGDIAVVRNGVAV